MMARGDRREAIFLGEKDRALFLDTLGQICEKTGWPVHAWVRGMQWFQNTCTGRFNQRRHLCGARLRVTRQGGSGGGRSSGRALDYNATNNKHWRKIGAF